MKKVRYNEIKGEDGFGNSCITSFSDNTEFDVIKETPKTFVIIKDEKEQTITKRLLQHFTIIN
jgi:hypothetical protein